MMGDVVNKAVEKDGSGLLSKAELVSVAAELGRDLASMLGYPRALWW